MRDELTVASPLTVDEKERFQQLKKAFRRGFDLALLRTTYEGRACAVICFPMMDGEMVNMTPVAMILIDADFDRLGDPTKSVEEK